MESSRTNFKFQKNRSRTTFKKKKKKKKKIIITLYTHILKFATIKKEQCE